MIAALVAVIWLDRGGAAASRGGLPRTGAVYWTAMLIAGTLGTAPGDAIADQMGLGVEIGTFVFGLLLAAVLGLRRRAAFANRATYWLAIVAVRSAGITLGNLPGDTCGLALSTALSCSVLVVALLL